MAWHLLATSALLMPCAQRLLPIIRPNAPRASRTNKVFLAACPQVTLDMVDEADAPGFPEDLRRMLYRGRRTGWGDASVAESGNLARMQAVLEARCGSKHSLDHLLDIAAGRGKWDCDWEAHSIREFDTEQAEVREGAWWAFLTFLVFAGYGLIA